jgi:hypothetical protein
MKILNLILLSAVITSPVLASEVLYSFDFSTCSQLPTTSQYWAYWNSRSDVSCIYLTLGSGLTSEGKNPPNLNEAVLDLGTSLQGYTNLTVYLSYKSSPFLGTHVGLPDFFSGHFNGDGVSYSIDGGTTWRRAIGHFNLPASYVMESTGNISYGPDTFPSLKIKIQHFESDMPSGGNWKMFVRQVIIEGTHVVTVPNLLGLTEANARTQIEASGFTVGTVSSQLSRQPAGTVISQSLQPGISVVPGQAINLVVSLGQKYGGGIGTADDPFQIWTAEQMNSIGLHSEDWSANFKLMADIDMSSYSKFNIIGNDTTNFTGTFDGCRYMIRNLTYVDKTNYVSYLGLFGYISQGTIKNLGLEDVYFYAKSINVGSIAAATKDAQIVDCYAAGSILVFSNYQNLRIGGLVGYSENGSITGSYNGCSLDVFTSNSQNYIGGLAGQANTIFILNCYNEGSINTIILGSGNSYAGGIIGYSSLLSCLKSYSTGEIFASMPYPYNDPLVGNSQGHIIERCFYDSDKLGTTPQSGTENGRTTAEMKTRSTFIGWDFDYDSDGMKHTWRMCQNGADYPRLVWEHNSKGDFSCPDGVDMYDLYVFASQWLCSELDYDSYTADKKHIVNFLDYVAYLNSMNFDKTKLAGFFNEWLKYNAYNADIAGEDNFVDFLDFAAFAESWMK